VNLLTHQAKVLNFQNKIETCSHLNKKFKIYQVQRTMILSKQTYKLEVELLHKALVRLPKKVGWINILKKLLSKVLDQFTIQLNIL